MRVGHRDTANEALLRDPALLTARAAAVASYPGGHNEGFPDTFKHLFIDFYRSIESGSYRRAATFPTFQEGRHELAVCEAILRSHQLQQWVAVET
jgi:predicted dehydrogenase